MASEPLAPGAPGALRSELTLAAALMGLLVVMLVPLPPALLDLLLALNLALTILLILVTLGVVALAVGIAIIRGLKRVELRQIAVDATAWYWHAMGVAWLILFAVLVVGQ